MVCPGRHPFLLFFFFFFSDKNRQSPHHEQNGKFSDTKTCRYIVLLANGTDSSPDNGTIETQYNVGGIGAKSELDMDQIA